MDLVSSLWSTLFEKKSYLPTEVKEDKDTTDSDKEETGPAKQKSFVQPTVTSQALMVLQALLWKVRLVEHFDEKNFSLVFLTWFDLNWPAKLHR